MEVVGSFPPSLLITDFLQSARSEQPGAALDLPTLASTRLVSCSYQLVITLILVQRNGIRLAEIFDKELFERKLRQLEQGYRKRFGDLLVYDIDDELRRFETYRTELRTYTVDSTALMYQAQQDNRSILVEGANVRNTFEVSLISSVANKSAGWATCARGLDPFSNSGRADPQIPNEER